ncbi:MAG TPA: hypothetical protein VGP93_04425, partial [Polyangiaceae bacterium]|nr:hypothetical protein [Polyangiaceae bacterium]
VGTHANCKAPYDPSCQAETTDGGDTWHIVKVPGDNWQEQAGPFVIDATTWVYAAPSGLYLTTNNGESFDEVTPAGAFNYGGGEVENHGITRDKNGIYYLTSYQGIVKSSDGHTWSLIPNSGGRTVSLVLGGGNFYNSDQWSPTYHTASEDDPMTWSSFPAPYTEPADTGGVFLDYDTGHHLLYSSNFAGGAWRILLE